MAALAKTEAGTMVTMPAENIDTDMIIPQTELITVSKLGLGDGLFARLRYLAGREPNPEFILNRVPRGTARFLLAGHNFGCGSSREHAVWALTDYGIRAVIATSFGEIFFYNCVRNGLLPARVTPEHHTRLCELASEHDGILNVRLDLPGRRIHVDECVFGFDISDADLERLMSGADAIAETLESASNIDAFVARDRKYRYWVYSLATTDDVAHGADGGVR
ncbi:3-isopropylmalate dehydratase small subunit [Burkholderia vietnamiensis]|uniref:3-isopropylmalate dehydratase small subunit n=1 Tax=Burkholderia vietnamiensis TaxID=60552 RepID=UPI001594DE07|nr:3-isopropylmalate dehydratase small subunit [Burkholderia vietnamiensis]